jgi:hypothetical protein
VKPKWVPTRGVTVNPYVTAAAFSEATTVIVGPSSIMKGIGALAGRGVVVMIDEQHRREPIGG